ncbi:hypothetical protein JF729_06140 [Mycobacterium intracellulare]|nr:hypothetical protein [Mycobacterium intracellulare]
MSAPPATLAACSISSCRPPAADVMVVDDIVTTGATARESVRVLQAAGVRVVAVLTIAAA